MVILNGKCLFRLNEIKWIKRRMRCATEYFDKMQAMTKMTNGYKSFGVERSEIGLNPRNVS